MKQRTGMERYLGRLGHDLPTIRYCMKQMEKFEHRPAPKPPKLMPNHLARAQRRQGEQQT